MRKTVFIIIFLLLLAIPIESNALSTNSSYNTVITYIFCDDSDSKCLGEKEWLDSKKEDYPGLFIDSMDITSEKELFNKLRKLLNINNDSNQITFIGNDYFIGFDGKVKSKIEDAIKSYSEEDYYCDLVLKVKFDEDVDSCIEINKDIYSSNEKKDNSISTIIIILVVLAVILVILIGLLITIKKRKRNKVKNMKIFDHDEI